MNLFSSAYFQLSFGFLLAFVKLSFTFLSASAFEIFLGPSFWPQLMQLPSMWLRPPRRVSFQYQLNCCLLTTFCLLVCLGIGGLLLELRLATLMALRPLMSVPRSVLAFSWSYSSMDGMLRHLQDAITGAQVRRPALRPGPRLFCLPRLRLRRLPVPGAPPGPPPAGPSPSRAA